MNHTEEIRHRQASLGVPSGERLHIAVAGRTNSGKSTLVNCLAGEAASIVSPAPGTTTDPVRKAIEIPGIGPCVLVDTAGLDDSDPALGDRRIEASMKMLSKADVILYVSKDDRTFRPADDQGRMSDGALQSSDDRRRLTDSGATTAEDDDIRLYRKLREGNAPVIPVLNIAGPLPSDHNGGPDRDKVQQQDNEQGHGKGAEQDEGPVTINAATGEGKGTLIEAIRRMIPEGYGERTITGELARAGDCVMLVMPQDIEAPKGRLILPQVQTLRELLDKGCSVVCCTAEGMEAALGRLSGPPQLIITDSQAFDTAWRLKPEGSLLTSFSILFAAYKGDISAFLDGVRALDGLSPTARVLIAEACSHVPAGEDIGRVKIPAMLRKRFGEGLCIDIVSGNDFPADLSGYSLLIHCGACMFTRQHVLSRIAQAQNQRIPVTNYGLVMAWAKGILDKVVIPL